MRRGREGRGRAVAHFTLVLFPAALSSRAPLLLMNERHCLVQNASLKASLSFPSVLISKLTYKQMLRVCALPSLTSTWREKFRPRLQDKSSQSAERQSERVRLVLHVIQFHLSIFIACLQYGLVIVLVIGFRKLIKHSH